MYLNNPFGLPSSYKTYPCLSLTFLTNSLSAKCASSPNQNSLSSSVTYFIANNANSFAGVVNSNLMSGSYLAMSVTSVTIPQGTEFPSYGLGEGTGTVVYRTTKDKTFVRSGSTWVDKTVYDEAVNSNDVGAYHHVEGAWNPGDLFADYKTYAIQFASATGQPSFAFEGTPNNADIAATFGDNITLNGVPLAETGICMITHSFGGGYLGLSVKVDQLTEEINVIEFKQDTIYQLHKINALKLCLIKSTAKLESIAMPTAINWNNCDYANIAQSLGIESVGGVPADGYVALMTYDKTLNGNSASGNYNFINLKDSSVSNLCDYVYVNDTLLASHPRGVVGTFSGFLYLYIPNDFGFRPVVEIRKGGYIGSDLTSKIYIDDTYLTVEGGFGYHSFMGFSSTKVTKTITDLTYTGITGNGTSYNNYVDEAGVDKKGLLINFSDNLSSFANLYNGGNKKFNLSKTTTFGSKVTLNGVPFNQIENSELKYLSTNLLWIYVPGMGVADNVIEIDSMVLDDARIPAMKFKHNGVNWGDATKIIFDSNGGSALNPVFARSNDSNVNFGNTANLQVPTKSGYRFNGWKLDGTLVNAADLITGFEITLVADWVEQVTVTVIDGESTSTMSIDKGSLLTAPSPAKTDDAYVHFTKWTTDVEGNVEYNFTDTVDADLTIYANYESHNFAKSYDFSEDFSKCTATLTCSCGYVYEEIVEGEFITDTEATCTTNRKGHYEYQFERTEIGNNGLVINDEGVNGIEVPNSAIGHDWGEPLYSRSGGKWTATRVCKNDPNHVETETVEEFYVCDKPADCTHNESGHYEAEFSNPAFVKQSTEPNSVTFSGTATGHDWAEPTYSWNGDECTATRVCKNDPNHVETETVTGIYLKDTDATCEGNETGHYEATFQNAAFTKQVTASNSVVKEGSAIGHSWSTPTYTWDGDECTATRVCANDPTHVETETVTATYVKDTDATCEGNETGHYEATFQNTAFAKQVTEANSVTRENSATGHDWGEVTYTWNDDECTATRVCANDPSHVETETVKGTYVKDFDATCVLDEKGHFEVSFENPAFEAQATESMSYENAGTATGHHYGEVQYSFDEEEHKVTATIDCVENDSSIVEVAQAVYVKDTDATQESNEKGHWEVTFEDERLGSYATEANSYEVPDSKLPEEKKGCGGSVVAASAVVTGLALAGVALVAGKKKEN